MQAGIAAICAHTNLDKATDGVNDTLARLLGLEAVEIAADGMSRIGRLPEAMSGETFARLVSARLDTAVRMKAGTFPVRTVAVCGGAGGDLVLPLLETCDAAVTGEVKHHEWLAIPEGKTVVDGGHYATEVGVTAVLQRWLQENFEELTVIAEDRQELYAVIKD